MRTYLTNARIPEPSIRKLLGHSVDVSHGYHVKWCQAGHRATKISLKYQPDIVRNPYGSQEVRGSIPLSSTKTYPNAVYHNRLPCYYRRRLIKSREIRSCHIVYHPRGGRFWR